MVVVTIRSQEFGREDFERDTLDEALAAIKNIAETAVQLSDGIERFVGLVINPNEAYDEGYDEAL